MFGYVTAYKPELKIKDYEAYKGVYCTLCKEMGKEYGLLSRFLLSYDGAFYVLYKMGIRDVKTKAEQSRCTFNPCKKCLKITSDSDIYKTASAITVILAYFKLKDNLNDSQIFKKLFLYLLLPYFSILKNKAIKKQPQVYKTIEKGMQEQFEFEKETEISLDKAADPTAKMLAWLFSFDEDKELAEKSRQFGYQLGRVVYFLDAFDDYKDDMKWGLFNPFKASQNIEEDAKISIRLSVGELTTVMQNVTFNKFSPIIDNIIYDGLNYQLERIIQKFRGEKE